MTVTIIATNETMGLHEEYVGVDYDLVTIKEVKSRKFKGYVSTKIRIKSGKRDIVLSSGSYDTMTIQDEETGRYLLRYTR